MTRILRPVSQATGVSTRTHLFGRVWDASDFAPILRFPATYETSAVFSCEPLPSRGSYVLDQLHDPDLSFRVGVYVSLGRPDVGVPGQHLNVPE